MLANEAGKSRIKAIAATSDSAEKPVILSGEGNMAESKDL